MLVDRHARCAGRSSCAVCAGRSSARMFRKFGEQRIQNCAARLTAKIKKYDHITPILNELHWLPIEKRIVFKILLFMYKVLHNLAPQYISDLVTRYKPTRTLRSSTSIQFTIPSYRTAFYGSRPFAVAGPSLWNALPLTVRSATTPHSFKRALKTHLFNQHFNQ